MSETNVQKQIADYVIKHKDNIYRLAFSYVKNSEDALDIVQESIYKAISTKDSLKNPEYIKTWFYKIVVNTSLDFIRKRTKLILVDDESLNSYINGSDDKYENFDLKDALDSLPDNYRTIIVLRFFEDMKIEEIAEILDENVNTVKTHLYKSLAKLRIKLNDYYKEA